MDEDTRRESRRIQRAKEREGQAFIAISDQHAASLRAFAADLGLFTTRGPRVGNIHALITLFAQAVERNHDAVLALLQDTADTDAAPSPDALAA